LLSTGGAIGGVFVAVVAPLVFKGVWELPIVIVAALVALALTAPPQPRVRPIRAMLRGWRGRLGPYLFVVLPLLLAMTANGGIGLEAAARWILVGGLVLLLGGAGRFLALTTAAVLVLATFVLSPAAAFRDRSFFGVVEVLRGPEEVVLMHGTTVHGRMAVDPARRTDPGSYYARSGPVGDLFAAWALRPPGTVRVVGLGAGSIAAYARPADDTAFFEIDPLVVRVAEDKSLFTYLSSITPSPRVAIGDGRLLIAAEPTDGIDLLVMDAFTSDAVPAHLITREAFADADRALRANGIIAVHISNRYYDLEPPIAGALHELGYTVRERQYVPSGAEARAGASLSDWLVATRDGTTVAALEAREWVAARPGDTPLTDDFPDLMRFFGR
ncbi:MAG TPA: fused MFS/spermidine synthase, partial [Candidatus Limnocylindrales bacterium]